MEDKLIYAYDFFDTIVHRRCNPEEILFSWAKWVSRLCAFLITAEEAYKIRKACEKELKINNEEADYDSLLEGVYKKIHIESLKLEEFVKASLEFEIQEEVKYIYCDDFTVQEIKDRFNAGNKIVVISDFYAGKDYIGKILESLGLRYLFEHLFISSDVNKRKSTGNLYKYVLEYLSLKASDIVMTGDNEISDCKIPTRLGIKCVYRPFKTNVLADLTALNNQIKKYCFSDIERYPLNSYAEECAYFISCLYQKVIQNNIPLVLFCAREGQALKKMFDYYAFEVKKETKLRSEYFYISRRAAIPPSLNIIGEEDFNLIFRQYDKLKVFEFLDCLGFTNEEIKLVCEEAGLSIDEYVSNAKYDMVFIRITSSSTFCNLYESRRVDQKNKILEYLTELGVDSNISRIAIVDVGWKGTIQDALQNVLGDSATLIGFYIGLKMNEYKCSNVENKYGLLFTDYPQKNKHYKLLSRNNLFWERILSADHGPTVGYGRDPLGHISPILKDDEKNRAVYNYMAQYQNFMIDACKKIIDAYTPTLLEPCEYYDSMITNLLWRECVLYPQISYIEKKSWSKFEDNFGTSSKKKQGLKSTLIKCWEYLPYGFNKQIFELINKINIKQLQNSVMIYFKFVYLLRVLQYKIHNIINKDI